MLVNGDEATRRTLGALAAKWAIVATKRGECGNTCAVVLATNLYEITRGAPHGVCIELDLESVLPW